MSDQALIRDDVEAYLARNERKSLMRFVIVGSVDDGKSTLIGRLLFDTNMVYDDQLAAARKASNMEDGSIDLSLLTDGLAAEREQGITIDVAYRYFTTEKRKFIVADTPGHVQYTRNMVTGASTADVCVILVDARLGVLEQSRRHAYIASLLGIPHLLVAVNKMDLKGYSRDVYEAIRTELRAFTKGLRFKDVTYVPVSALKGDNIVKPSTNTPWYDGETVLSFLEDVSVADDRNLSDFRYPVQYVLRPNLDYRGFSGQVASGVIRRGDTVMSLPSGKQSRVKHIDTFEGELEEAFTPQSVTLRLEDEIDISRGDMLVLPNNRPRVTRSFEADLVWLHERPLDTQKTYLIKHTTQVVRGAVETIHAKLDLTTLQESKADRLELNDIARVRLTCHRALYVDAYAKNRVTGAFILVDSLYNTTVGAGMIRELPGHEQQSLDDVMKELRAGSGLKPATQVSPRERRERFGQSGCTIWLTGLPGSGRWSLAYALERKLFDLGRTAHVVAPFADTLDSIMSAAHACTSAGLITICAFPSYKRGDRQRVRDALGADKFIEVFVDTDAALCRERRPDASFDGFEPPTAAELTVHLEEVRMYQAIDGIVDVLGKHGQFDER
ncbi:MAG TPA: sulfate adenylyltransferase subunit CysN [Polyangiales bacterium]|nr:sulfate adenylyltransferase subunit CysN [Polyangiales bacterium]